ncbi:hypothetical protein [Falsiroseomonas oryzae]|uniref:hypothetical protein n=1 Tax=Falsiroseomonas oryzae TaxID=2766473 RepID=UPI0022EA5786|nr:hypothetical protein [Roseomonas sp. MO-31]
MPKDGEGSSWRDVAQRGVDRVFSLPAYVLSFLLVFLGSLAVIAGLAADRLTTNFILALGALALAVSVGSHFLLGGKATASAYHVPKHAWRERGAGENDKLAFAQMLADSYDPKADTIYVVSSGYSARGFDQEAKSRMTAVMARLDECLRQGVSVIRFQVQPDSLPLADAYVDWVCQQLQRKDRDGNSVRGEVRTIDARRLLNLPSMALVRGRDGSGVVRHVIESMEPRPDGGTDDLVRTAEIAWAVHYDKDFVDALKRKFDGIANREAPMSAEKYRQIFGSQGPVRGVGTATAPAASQG